MAYVPVNPQLFSAVYSGAMAGMAVSDRLLQSNNPTNYASQCNIAMAFAICFDTEWNDATAINAAQAETIWGACFGIWQNRSPNQNDTNYTTPSFFVRECDNLIALVVQTAVAFAAQGITPPAWGGGGASVPNPSAAGQTLQSSAAGPVATNSFWDLPGGFAINSFSGGANLEVGQSEVNPTYSASYNETPDSASIAYTGAAGSPLVLITPFTSGQILQTFTSNVVATLTRTLTAIKSTTTKTANSPTKFNLPFLFDIVTAGSIVATQGFLDTMRTDHGAQLHQSMTGTYGASLSVGAGQQFAFAYPTALTLTSVHDINGFLISPSTVGTVAGYVNPFGGGVNVPMTLVTFGGVGIGAVSFSVS